jgi:aminopeptidase N
MNINSVRDPIVRTSAWLALWEAVLYGEVAPRDFISLLLRSFPLEGDELIAQHLLGTLRTGYWSFLGDSVRNSLAADVEAVLWRELARSTGAGRKRAYFDALVSVTLSPEGTARLARVWRMQETIDGLPFADDQYIDIAKALAVRDYPGSDSILAAQLERITNADRKLRFQFVMPALSGNRQVRDSVFESFLDVSNRKREAWVLEAQAALNHPLRSQHAAAHVGRSLLLVEEIQRTGDIFFPLRWLNATLGGHQSEAIANQVRSFLNARPDYPPQLRAKMLQAADGLFRSVSILRR